MHNFFGGNTPFPSRFGMGLDQSNPLLGVLSIFFWIWGGKKISQFFQTEKTSHTLVHSNFLPETHPELKYVIFPLTPTKYQPLL